jgi:hypothetical protein
MRGSSSLGTILEASTCGEGFGAMSVGPWEGWIHIALGGTLAENLNNYRVRAKATGYVATFYRPAEGASCNLIVSMPRT